MRLIRFNTFETNSSSTHSYVIVNEKEWDKLINGHAFIRVVDDDNCNIIYHRNNEDLYETGVLSWADIRDSNYSWSVDTLGNYHGDKLTKIEFETYL